MAEWRRQDDGGYPLTEDHHPIRAAAAVCQEFCRSKLSLFEILLAPARAERIEHILTGARRCLLDAPIEGSNCWFRRTPMALCSANKACHAHDGYAYFNVCSMPNQQVEPLRPRASFAVRPT
jgi:hypothetical protein